MNYEFFKYPQTTVKPIFIKHHGRVYSIRKIPDEPSKIEDTVNRAKAVFKYFKDLTVGRDGEQVKTNYVLDPDFGRKWASNYQSKHGRFGDKLVHLLGSNPSREEIAHSGLIDK
jgi:hypothetical protein